ncbi:MFS transporter [Tsuneonella sp. YG55]|uniref:MFS transporter n=1 Tax=Tsuneonella litorea TaxID=2976475 RepID=A0A9X2W313_9SPHN|nr:MFS transporter [Tsuneonella litorea]MCT2559664.1 MFS transporter [Tsuneonella litorea]
MEIPAEEAPVTGPVDALTPRQRRRAIAAATLGNGLEFYDFITYAFFAIQIGNTFFPSESPFLSLMGSLAAFGAGFITRPLGAAVLGTYADRHGRKPAMLVSMTMMGVGILLLALTPGYATIGYAAPVIAVLARLIQGFALGGEVGSATIYMMESSTPQRRGFTMSFQGASQAVAATIGSLVGLMLSLVMSEAELASYGWRIALLLGATIVPLALVIRHSLPETIHHADTAVVADDGWRSYLRPIVCGFLIIASGTIGSYIFTYMATYGQNTLKLSTTISFSGSVANNAIQIVAVMTGAILSDRFGRKAAMVLPQCLFALSVVPCFLWLTTQRDAFSFIGANLVLAGIGSFVYGAVYAAISESIPKAVRARVFALVYSIPVAVFGGTTQMVVTWILEVTGDPMSIAYYLTGVSLVGLGAMIAMRESAPVRIGTLVASPA